LRCNCNSYLARVER